VRLITLTKVKGLVHFKTTRYSCPRVGGAPVSVVALSGEGWWFRMRTSMMCFVAGMLLASVRVPCVSQEFKPYAGSKVDEKASREASAAAPGKQSEVYTTSDALEKVYTFYKGLYKEFTMRSTGPRLPSGQQVKWYFFILDGGTTLADSKSWMKIQRPYVGGADGQDIRDVTIIQTVHAK
jgi:hypothetical protein